MTSVRHCQHCLRSYTGALCPRCDTAQILPVGPGREQALRDAIVEALRCLTLIGHRDGTLRDWPAKAQAAADALRASLAFADAVDDEVRHLRDLLGKAAEHIIEHDTDAHRCNDCGAYCPVGPSDHTPDCLYVQARRAALTDHEDHA